MSLTSITLYTYIPGTIPSIFDQQFYNLLEILIFFFIKIILC